MRITQAAFAAARRQQALPRAHKVDRVGLAFDLSMHDSAGRYCDHQVFAVAAMFARRAARAAATRLEPLLILKLQQGIKLRVDFEENITTPTAISAVGATARHIFLAPKGGETIAAIAGFYRDMRAIY